MKINDDRKTILITGCGRGLGLELAKQFATNNWNVIAGARDCEDINDEFKNLDINFVKLDVCDQASLAHLKSNLQNYKLDVIINNAGIFRAEDDFGSVTQQTMLDMYNAHTVAPLMISQMLFDNILSGSNKLIIFITGRMGSFNSYSGNGVYSYRASKAAANMIVKIMAYDLEQQNIKVVAIHPGWIKTRMGGENAKICTKESAQAIFKMVTNSHDLKSGCFYNYEEATLNW